MCMHRMNRALGPPLLLDTCVLQMRKEIGDCCLRVYISDFSGSWRNALMNDAVRCSVYLWAH